MLIAWQTINAVRRPSSKQLHPRLPGRRAGHHHPRPPARPPAERPGQLLRRAASWSRSDMLRDLERAKIVITNYHAFKLRERMELSKGGRVAAAGPRRRRCNTLETEGQMLQRVMPELMGMKNILVLNDEAHHCYREKPGDGRRRRPEGRRARRRPRRTTRPPASGSPGLEAVKRKLGVARVDRPLGHALLPARLRLRRGHALPLDDERLLADGRHRVRHRQAAARAGRRQHPRRRDAEVPQPVGAHRQEDAEEGARQGRRRSTRSASRVELQTALEALYGHYEKTFELWQEARHRRAALLHRRLQQHVHLEAGLRLHLRASSARTRTASTTLENGRLALFRNFDEHGNPLARPDTLLIDSEQLESGEALDDELPRDGGRRDRALPPRDRRAHRRPRSRPRTSPTRTCCAR